MSGSTPKLVLTSGMRVRLGKAGVQGPTGPIGPTGSTGATGPAPPDADAVTKGKVQLAGDLGGAAAGPMVKARTTTVVVGPTGTTADYVCDGTADDVEINAAVASVSAAGGGTVWLRAGTYVLYAGIVAKNNVHLRGEGMFASKLTVNTTNMRSAIITGRTSPPTGFIVSDLALDGTNYIVDGVHFYKGIDGDQWNDCKIFNVYCHNTTATGLGVDGMYRCTIDRCLVVQCGTFGTLGNNGIGIASGSQAKESWIVSNNVCIQNANNDYLVECDNVNGTDEAVYSFTNNISIKAGTAGFRNSGTNNVTFLGNHAYYPGQNSTTGCAGIYIDQNTASHLPLHNIIKSNHISGSLKYGIFCAEPTSLCTVEGNTVRTSALQGIFYAGSNGQILNNNVFQNGSHGINVGAPLGGSAHTSIIISGNHVYNNALLVNNTNAIYIDGSHATLTDVLCMGNRCYDDQGTQTQRGIRVETPAGTYSGIVIRDNILNSNKSFAVSLGATIGISCKNNHGGTGATKTGANPEALQDLGTTGGTITLSNTIGNHVKVTANANINVHIDAGVIVGDTLVFVVTQDGTGSRTVTWPANFKKAGGTLTLSTAAGAVDVISMRYDGTNWLETGRALNVS